MANNLFHFSRVSGTWRFWKLHLRALPHYYLQSLPPTRRSTTCPSAVSQSTPFSAYLAVSKLPQMQHGRTLHICHICEWMVLPKNPHFLKEYGWSAVGQIQHATVRDVASYPQKSQDCEPLASCHTRRRENRNCRSSLDLCILGLGCGSLSRHGYRMGMATSNDCHFALWPGQGAVRMYILKTS